MRITNRITKSILKEEIEAINMGGYLMYDVRLDCSYNSYRVDYYEKDTNKLRKASMRMTARECYCYLRGIQASYLYTKPF